MIRGIIDLIVDDTTCQNLIGSANSVVKVFPVVAAQDTPKPYVLLRRVPGETAIVKGQASEMDRPQFKAVVFGDTYKVCIDIMNAVRNVIDDYSGTNATIVYDRIWYQSSEDLFDKDDNAFVISDTYSARVKRVL